MIKALLSASLIGALLSSAAFGAWRWSNLDPFNRNSAIRTLGRYADPGVRLGHARTRVLTRVAHAVANDSALQEKARSGGWTSSNCRTVGLGATSVSAALYGGAICAALSVGEPLTGSACTATVISAGTLITELVCIQMCHDHHLRDCQ